MQDLTPVGLSQDGRRLLLVSSTGEEFAVSIDTRLRATMRGENARLGQLEMKMESALRPRDIQARIRAGESPEDVAAAAQTSVDAIMVFATPVLAERAHVAQSALRASVRRRSGESSSAGATLGEAAEIFFGDHTLHDEDVEWDAWRQADGRWALVATYTLGGRERTAEFSHDLPGRYVVAENDDARILTGELREPDAKGAATTGRSTQSRRLSSVPSQDELPLGDDAIELVRDRKAAAAEKATAEEPAEEPGAATADADWIAHDPITEEQRDAGPGASPGTEPILEADDGSGDAGPGADLSDEPVAETEPAQAEEPLVGPVLGRDHVRWRQERVTHPSAARAMAGLLAGNITPTA